MFYFAAGRDGGTALALSRSEDQIGPGAWTKAGQPELTNPEALVNRRNWHKYLRIEGNHGGLPLQCPACCWKSAQIGEICG